MSSQHPEVNSTLTLADYYTPLHQPPILGICTVPSLNDNFVLKTTSAANPSRISTQYTLKGHLFLAKLLPKLTSNFTPKSENSGIFPRSPIQPAGMPFSDERQNSRGMLRESRLELHPSGAGEHLYLLSQGSVRGKNWRKKW